MKKGIKWLIIAAIAGGGLFFAWKKMKQGVTVEDSSGNVFSYGEEKFGWPVRNWVILRNGVPTQGVGSGLKIVGGSALVTGTDGALYKWYGSVWGRV